jgi:SPP1 family phage portal protein
VFTDKLIIVAKEENGKYTLDVKPNVFGKIPIVYYDIDKPAWYYVQRYIDRLEKLYSGHADTNDYFGSPALKLKGPIENPPDKDTAGKIFQFKAEIGQDGKPAYGDMEYLTWPLAPESIKMEIDNLKDVIYSLTSTPDLSFNNIKGVGNLSGLAIKLMFMDAEMNAMNYQEIFDEGLTRRFSLLKSMLSMLNYASKAEFDNLEIDFQFGSILPKDEKELIEMLSTARMGKALISERTAAKNVPFVDDVDKELEEMDAESEKEAQRALQITESFNPPADQNEDNQE